MRRRSRPRRRLPVALTLAAAMLLSLTPATAALDQACTTSHTPERIWLGHALTQTFTPSGPDLTRFDARLYFRRAFSGKIQGRLQLHVPTERVIEGVALAGPMLASASTTLSATAGTVRWVAFTLEDPLPIPVQPGRPILEIELRPGGTNPPWGWTECRSAYPGGRAYGRAPIPYDGQTLDNDHLNFTIDDRDFQFRAWSS